VSEGDVLLKLAGAVADGERIEWAVALRHLADGRSRAVASELRQIAEQGAATTNGTLTGADRAAGRPRIHWLARVVVLLAVVHVLVGGAAVAAGRVPPGAFLPVARLGTALALATGGLALYLAGRDERARWLGAVFVALSSGPALSFAGGLVSPAWARRAVAAVLVPLPDCLVPWLLWNFVSRFPAVVRFDRLERVLVAGARLSLWLGLLLAAANAAASVAGSSALSGILRDNHQGIFWIASFAGSLAPLVLMGVRVRVAAPGERRRVGWFVAGVVVGLGPFLLVVAGDALVPAVGTWLDQPGVTPLVGIVLYACEATLPLTVGYAVFARRVLSARLALHHALRAALARGALALAMLIPASVLAGLLWSHRAVPVGEVLGSGAGRAMGLLLGMVVVLLFCQRALTGFVDRLLGPPIADPSIALSRLSRATGGGQTIEEVLLQFGEIVGSALGMRTGVMMAAAGDVLLPIPGSTGRALPLDSAIVSVLRAGQDVTVLGADEIRSLFAWVPEAERQWVVDSEVAVLAPVRDRTGELVAAVGFGPRPNATPYTGVALNFVSAAAAAVAAALPHDQASAAFTPASGSEEPARECPACGHIAPNMVACARCAAASVDAALPHVVNGKYRVRNVLGRGGMGVVYLAEDIGLGREVALKTLPKVSASALLRLRGEARAMAAVAGPHLATIHALESWRGIPILAVEYLAGGTLAARTARPQAWADVRAVAVAMGQALAAMHARGLVHSDVKPSNIGFTSDGTPKLLDFGLARLARLPETASGDSTQRESWLSSDAGRWMGTLLYLSPERLRGRTPYPSDDLWALSISLLECLLGRHPLRGSEEELLNGRMPLRLETIDLADAPVGEFFRRALSSDPRNRFGTAVEFVGSVDACPG
jgi:hypothetical protein